MKYFASFLDWSFSTSSVLNIGFWFKVVDLYEISFCAAQRLRHISLKELLRMDPSSEGKKKQFSTKYPHPNNNTSMIIENRNEIVIFCWLSPNICIRSYLSAMPIIVQRHFFRLFSSEKKRQLRDTLYELLYSQEAAIKSKCIRIWRNDDTNSKYYAIMLAYRISSIRIK